MWKKLKMISKPKDNKQSKEISNKLKESIYWYKTNQQFFLNFLLKNWKEMEKSTFEKEKFKKKKKPAKNSKNLKLISSLQNNFGNKK